MPTFFMPTISNKKNDTFVSPSIIESMINQIPQTLNVEIGSF